MPSAARRLPRAAARRRCQAASDRFAPVTLAARCIPSKGSTFPKMRSSKSRFAAREILPDSAGSMSSTQTWDPERYARYARFVTDLVCRLLLEKKKRPGERILDLDCGDGVLAAKLAEMG